MGVDKLYNEYLEAHRKRAEALLAMDRQVFALRDEAEGFNRKARESLCAADRLIDKMHSYPEVTWRLSEN